MRRYSIRLVYFLIGVLGLLTVPVHAEYGDDINTNTGPGVLIFKNGARTNWCDQLVYHKPTWTASAYYICYEADGVTRYEPGHVATVKRRPADPRPAWRETR